LNSITELHGGRVFNLRAIPLTACQLGPLLALLGHPTYTEECPLSELNRIMTLTLDNVR